MSTLSMPMHTLKNKLMDGITTAVSEFFRDVEKMEKSYQEEIRGLRSLLNNATNPEMRVPAKDKKRLPPTVSEQTPERDSAEPLAKMPKMEPTEQFDSSEPLVIKEEPNEALPPTANIPKEEQAEISTSLPEMLDIKVSEPYTLEPLADVVPNVANMEVSTPVDDVQDGSEISISEPQNIPKRQQIGCDKILAPEEEMSTENTSTVECLERDSNEVDTGRRDTNTPLQDMAFGNLNTDSECPLPSSIEGILNKDLGSLEPPKNPSKKLTEDTLQKTILEFPRMRPYKPCSVVTGPPGRRPFLTRLFQACKDFPEDKQPLITKVVTQDDFELMQTALGNVPKGPGWHCQSSREAFTYHNDAPPFPSLPQKQSDQKLLVLKMVNKSCSHTSKEEEEVKSQALREYCRSMCVNWSPCGNVVHPNTPWLGALPHGMVYDPKEDPSFGLVHVSCSGLQSFMACRFLSSENGVVRLKSNAPHYTHIQGELMVTGMAWCDLVVVAKDDVLVQRIYRDGSTVDWVRKKLAVFYFNYFLPRITENGK
uniref:uncharacterized protein LOC131105917 n=1 Tax=Doryrhamphus excisus TaxID=161450 RepID=UPI0025AE5259|nr:uncharacterized protein LOC131105917 [Doryrhamphus excisus]